MKAAIFGFTIDLEFLILLGILYLIVMVNVIYNCVKVNGVREFIKEGFEAITNYK